MDARNEALLVGDASEQAGVSQVALFGLLVAGVALLTQDVAAQAGPFDVRANCIAPETILTERNRERIPEAQQTQLIEAHPLRRLGTPEALARS